jgi:hypothetical protein
MILQRISDAFRRQDWFTVTVETLIVVLGVFLGLQINNWNTGRSDRAVARIILELLEQDITQIVVRTVRALETHELSLAATARLIHGIQGEKFDEETRLQDLVAVTNFAAPPGTPATFTQLVSSGRLKLIHNQELRRSLTEYDAFIRFVQSQYGVFMGPVTQTRQTLMQAATLNATGLVKSIDELGQLKAVDSEMLFNNPQMMTALQTTYDVHENVHAFLSRIRAQLVEIQTQSIAEQETTR